MSLVIHRLCSLLNRLILFYDISRDHVIKGSFVSFVVFLLLGYLLTNDFRLILDNAGIGIMYMFSNAAVQSLNQLIDHESDKINKPWLPLPNKQITIENLKYFCIFCYLVSFLMIFGFYGITSIEGQRGISLVILASLYSKVPFTTFKFKQVPFLNTIIIIICRCFIYHNALMDKFQQRNPSEVDQQIMNSFYWMHLYNALAICLYKDVPDIKGDRDIDAIITLPMILGQDISCLFSTFLLLISIYISQFSNIVFVAFLLIMISHHLKHHHSGNYKQAYLSIWTFYDCSMIAFLINIYINHIV